MRLITAHAWYPLSTSLRGGHTKGRGAKSRSLGPRFTLSSQLRARNLYAGHTGRLTTIEKTSCPEPACSYMLQVLHLKRHVGLSPSQLIVMRDSHAVTCDQAFEIILSSASAATLSRSSGKRTPDRRLVISWRRETLAGGIVSWCCEWWNRQMT